VISQIRKEGRSSERGQILAIVALSLVVLIAFAGLTADVGLIYGSRRQMQTAADAAAVAGANALQGSSTVAAGYVTAAQDAAAMNGFSTSTSGVAVNVSEVTCPNASGEQCVKVDVSQPQPTYFLRVLGYNSLNVSTEAIAGGVNGPACIYALDPSADQALEFNGNINISASCGILVDSSNSNGLYATGNGTITTTSTGVAGNYNSASLGNMNFSPTPITGIAPAPDPLASLAAPSVTDPSLLGTTSSSSYSYSGNVSSLNVPAGVYKDNGNGGVSIGGNVGTATFTPGGTSYGNGIFFSGNVNNLVFNPGQYQSGSKSCNGSSFDNSNPPSVCIGGNVGSATFNPGNYTFYGPVEISGNTSVTLSPGTYYGGISITGNNNTTFQPGLYILAGGGLQYTGNSNLSGTGVTFYDTTGLGGYGPVNLTGNETASLSAPTSGSMKGILFFQDRSISSSAPASSVIGNSSSTIDGVVYFPTTGLNYFGNSSGSGYTFLIADSIKVIGNATMTIGSNYSSLGGTSPIASNTIYE
jgi:hypothetical protein